MLNQKPIILFDGVCKLCNTSVRFIQKRDKKNRFRFVALQSEKGKALVKKFQIPGETDSVVLIRQRIVFIESDAAIEIFSLLPFPWNCIRVFRFLPKSWRNLLYRWIAKNRYQWFGKHNTACNIDQ